MEEEQQNAVKSSGKRAKTVIVIVRVIMTEYSILGSTFDHRSRGGSWSHLLECGEEILGECPARMTCFLASSALQSWSGSFTLLEPSAGHVSSDQMEDDMKERREKNNRYVPLILLINWMVLPPPPPLLRTGCCVSQFPASLLPPSLIWDTII